MHWVRKNCLRLLYRTCGHHARLPSALAVPVSYDRTGDALYRGGYADVWKGSYCSQDVAVKVIRTYSSDELQKVINVSCHFCSIYTHYVPKVLLVDLLQGSCSVEIPSTPQYPTAIRNIDVGKSVRNGVKVDGKWKHQSIRQGTSGGQPVRTCMSSPWKFGFPSLLTIGNPPAGRCRRGVGLPPRQRNGSR